MERSTRSAAHGALAAGYTTTQRTVDLVGMTAFAALAATLALRITQQSADRRGAIAFAIVLGWAAADVVSGLVHWAADTWGSPEWPVVGAMFIRTFREHHTDPLAITRHDFVETNGSNCLVSAPLLALAHLLPLATASAWAVPCAAFVLALALAVFATSQVHKWAHTAVPPRPVAQLQRWGVILSPERHDIHHRAPYDRAYCITAGWLNGLLDRARFFRGLERVLTSMTGALPRHDDLGVAAAAALAAESGVLAPTRPTTLRPAAPPPG